VHHLIKHLEEATQGQEKSLTQNSPVLN